MTRQSTFTCPHKIQGICVQTILSICDILSFPVEDLESHSTEAESDSSDCEKAWEEPLVLSAPRV